MVGDCSMPSGLSDVDRGPRHDCVVTVASSGPGDYRGQTSRRIRRRYYPLVISISASLLQLEDRIRDAKQEQRSVIVCRDNVATGQRCCRVFQAMTALSSMVWRRVSTSSTRLTELRASEWSDRERRREGPEGDCRGICEDRAHQPSRPMSDTLHAAARKLTWATSRQLSESTLTLSSISETCFCSKRLSPAAENCEGDPASHTIVR